MKYGRISFPLKESGITHAALYITGMDGGAIAGRGDGGGAA